MLDGLACGHAALRATSKFALKCASSPEQSVHVLPFPSLLLQLHRMQMLAVLEAFPWSLLELLELGHLRFVLGHCRAVAQSVLRHLWAVLLPGL